MPARKSVSKKAVSTKGASRERKGARKGTESSPADRSEPDAEATPIRFPVVGIGASAGGLGALESFFEKLPADTGMAFVVVTHLHPGHVSLLPELLGKKAKVSIMEAGDGVPVEADRAYVAPPGQFLGISGGKLRLYGERAVGEDACPLPIDFLFRSLSEAMAEKAVAIVLSGSGSDGTLGVKAIKGKSGMAMAQDPVTAEYPGMPSGAISTGLVDYVLPPEDMPDRLVAYVQGPYLAAELGAETVPSIPAEQLRRICRLLRVKTGNDFSSYKSSTVSRRIERRMNVHQIRKPGDYVRFLEENPHEIEILFKELLIGVTHFFRDPEAWDSLASQLKAVLESRPDESGIRAWVPGCSTGEEAYSLAMVLRECIDELGRSHEVQIFATDLDVKAIDTARVGQFPEGIAADVSPERLRRFFTRRDGIYRISKEIREEVVFAPQNLIGDPPFTKLDIVSCRNLMIYLEADLQRKLFPIFHYALKPGGLLFLGPSESIGIGSEFFEPLDKRWKIFRRCESVVKLQSLPDFPAQPTPPEEGLERTAKKGAPLPGLGKSGLTLVERLLLNRFVPVCLVANERGSIVYIHGRTGNYLEPSPGEPRNNLFEMAREGLPFELASAMRESARTGAEIQREGVRVRANGGFVIVDLLVSKIPEPEALRGLFLVVFRPRLSEAPPRERTRRRTTEDDRGSELERELRYLKESYQTVLEELETSNEELKSTNEELQSTNEELQSSNEELETSKEEMQSLNEELATVNNELQSKVDELSQANDDMQNLLNSTDIALVFLDSSLNIKRFTEQATELFMLRPTDVGRPISELVSTLKVKNLAGICSQVLKTLAFREAEVETRDGRTYLMRVMPYRTSRNVIDGLVLTFVNVGRLMEAELVAARARRYFAGLVETVRGPLVVVDCERKVVSANRSFCRLFRTTVSQIVGSSIFDLGPGEWNAPRVHELLDVVLVENGECDDFEIDIVFPGVGRRVFSVNARRLDKAGGATDVILLSLEDLTNRRPDNPPGGEKP